ncbi:ANTAR domain-containing protein [Streptomyces sp. CRN 30]|uniref:ANTAR domain-containing protein n=1 Tax=Streptomyces sp. CRN 30 TaxID=3075613 RepID=UPI002A81A63B|nr:ANTAR domain-containing protein [Streptomyces sp. CRN 30]
MTSAAASGPTRRTARPAVECRVEAERALLVPRGDLVQGCVEALAEALAGLPDGITHIHVDMTHVTFMDGTGLRFLDLLDGHGHRRRVRVTTAHWHGQPRRTLELSGLPTDDPLRVPDRPGDGAERVRVLLEEVEQLRRAIASRPVIDQARGVLMAVHSCTPDQAWHILREASQLSNTKLRSVAEWVTASAGDEGPPPPPEVRAALRTALFRHGH